MAASITRTITTARAYAWAFVGADENGKPVLDKVGNVDFVCATPNTTLAYRALKAAGVKCQKQYVSFDIVSEEVRAISFEDFMTYSVPVKRLDNGDIKPIEDNGDIKPVEE